MFQKWHTTSKWQNSYAETFLHLSWGSDLVLFSKLSTSKENKQISKEVSPYEEKKLKRITT
jgi:hypothetical protein